MAEAAPNYREHEEFWKPAVGRRVETPSADEQQVSCPHCQATLTGDSRFCHLCGAKMGPERAAASHLPVWLDFASVCERLGQSTASLIALILGCACLVSAVATGFFFTVATLSDWQAVQLWRIEWLLGAVALFALGVLLRRR